jgi:fatty acid desaturase
MQKEHYTTIREKKYDLTGFNHPGGAIPISLAIGRDATALFESHHQFSDRAKLESILKKYEVDSSDDSERDIPNDRSYDWNQTESDPFTVELKELVRKELGSGIKASFWRIMEMIILGVFFIASYALYYCGYWISLLLLPVAAWLLSVNIYHDASHFAVSRNGSINQALTYVAPYFSSPFMWYHQHIIGHHCYTNIPEADPDLYHTPQLIRHTSTQRHRKIHAWQYITFAITWLLSVQYLSTAHTLKFYLSGEAFQFNRAVNVIPFTRTRMVMHIIGRILTVFSLYVLPLFYVGLTLKGLIWITIPMLLYSIFFMVCTQINHLTPESVDVMDRNYFKHQIITSNNINTGNYLTFLFMGGLNYQIEHHLFPSVNHTHLHRIAPIVKKLCEKHNVPYSEYPSIWSAVKAHVDHLVEKSRPE